MPDNGFTPSPFQEAIFSFITDSAPPRPDGSVNAVAGSGKTTTLVNAAKLLREPGLFCAFNKHIAEALNGKLRSTSMSASTIHSIGMRTLNKGLSKRPRLDDNKYRRLIREYLRDFQNEYSENKDAAKHLGDLTRFARLTMTDYTDLGAMIQMANRYNLDFEVQYKRAVESILNHGQRLAETNGEIDFTDMIYLPNRLKMQPDQYGWILVDECQDLSRAQLELVLKCRAPGGRMLFVGDPCQPTGTLVKRKVAGGNRWHKSTFEDTPIEQLKVGDQIVTATLRDGAFYGNGKVRGITKRPYAGFLIVATLTTGQQSRYTPNHHCIASFKPFDGKWFVYVMRKDNRFRVGMSATICNERGSASRFRAEGADGIWILGFYDTRVEALMWEAAVSGRFGLPQLMFNESKFTTGKIIAQAWEFIGDNSERASECLKYFGRDIRYPLFTKDMTTTSLRRPIQVHASNLMTGCLMLPFNANSHFKSANWRHVTITRQAFAGSVYSLTVDPHETYFGDDILTHNCQAIMAFAGADSKAYHEIHARLGTHEMPLSICYRCPAEVVKMAQEIVPQIQPRPGAPAGTIDWRTEEDLYTQAQADDLVMCRRNAPLMKHCLRLIRKGAHARLRGRDVGKEIANLIREIGSQISSYDQFPDAVEFYYHQQKAVLVAKDASDTQLEMLDDKCTTVSECFAGLLDCRSVDELAMRIESIFSDYGTAVWFSSIHRAKGLEANRTWILEFDRLGEPIGRDCSDEEAQQELNLKYVSITRSTDTMFLVKREK